LDEKRARMVEIFTETMEPFTLKDLEKIAPKRKGITSQSVKDVVQSLVDDDLVSTDKCGIQTIFWCFPSAAVQQKRARLEMLQEKISKRRVEIEGAKKQKEKLNDGREESKERTELIENISKLQSKHSELKTKLALYASCDPEALDDLREKTKVCKEAANRWTDNVFVMKSFVIDKSGIDRNDFDRNFSIPEEFDYVEEDIP